MLKIGITGGIGSGKTTASKIIRNLGVPVFASDEVGREALNKNKRLIKKVKKEFGDEMYLSDGSLNRSRLASLVFSNPQALEKLSALVHPIVEAQFNTWCELHEKRPYVLKEAAILFESGSYHDLDKVIHVFAPREQRIERVIKRDHTTKEEVEKRIRFQYSDEERNRLADYIIMNEDGTDLLPEIMDLHEILLNENQYAKSIFS